MMVRERSGGVLRRTPATASALGVRSEENVPPCGALDTTAPPTPVAASRTPLRAIQQQGQPQPLAATPKKDSAVKEAACKGKKPAVGERFAEVRRPKVRDAILFWEENRNRNVQLKRTQAKLKKALKLNASYRQELASRTFIEQDKDETQREVEYELAKVIISLTEEVASLRQEVDVSNTREEYYVSLLKRREEDICQMQSQLDQSNRVYESIIELETKMQKMEAAAATTHDD